MDGNCIRTVHYPVMIVHKHQNHIPRITRTGIATAEIKIKNKK